MARLPAVRKREGDRIEVAASWHLIHPRRARMHAKALAIRAVRPIRPGYTVRPGALVSGQQHRPEAMTLQSAANKYTDDAQADADWAGP